MEAKTLSEIARVYNDFEPTTEWAQEEGSDSLLVFLPGFKREEIKVQITSDPNIRVMGERQVGGSKWSRFRKEVPISSNHETTRVTARFENGILFVKLPKVIVPAKPPSLEEAEKPTPEFPKPPPPQKIDQKKETVKPGTTTKQTAEKTYEKDPTKAVKLPEEEKPRALDEESSERHLEEEKVTSTKRKMVGDSVNGEKKHNEESRYGDGSNQGKPEISKQIPEIYKQVMANYVRKVKKPGNLVNLVLVLLLVLVPILYAKNAITSTGKTQTELFEDL